MIMMVKYWNKCSDCFFYSNEHTTCTNTLGLACTRRLCKYIVVFVSACVESKCVSFQLRMICVIWLRKVRVCLRRRWGLKWRESNGIHGSIDNRCGQSTARARARCERVRRRPTRAFGQEKGRKCEPQLWRVRREIHGAARSGWHTATGEEQVGAAEPMLPSSGTCWFIHPQGAESHETDWPLTLIHASILLGWKKPYTGQLVRFESLNASTFKLWSTTHVVCRLLRLSASSTINVKPNDALQYVIRELGVTSFTIIEDKHTLSASTVAFTSQWPVALPVGNPPAPPPHKTFIYFLIKTLRAFSLQLFNPSLVNSSLLGF